jgi:DNA invertase Pin-like site-specific DNA recombinase
MVAAIYARQSLDRAGLGAAVSRQLEDCRALAHAQHLDVAAEYVDNDVSASSGPRPEFLKLMAAIGAGEVDSIVVWHTDRLYRRVRDLVDLVDLAESRKLSIMSVRSGSLDLTTPSGRMLAGMLGHAARYEVEQKSIRQSAGFLQRAREGVMKTPQPLYGYRHEGRSMLVNEDEARIVRLIFTRYIAGWPTIRIVRSLNNAGILTARGTEWQSQTIHILMRNPGLRGLSTYKGEIVGVGRWKPIISEKRFEQFLAVQAKRPKHRVLPNDADRFLSGVARCGTCGGPMGARLSAGGVRPLVAQYDVYRCIDGEHVSSKANTVDSIVEAAIIGRLTDGSDSVYEFSSELVRGELSEIEQLQTSLAEGGTDSHFHQTASDRVAELQRSISDQLAGNLFLAQMRHRNIPEHWRGLTVAEKRRVARTLLTLTIRKKQRGGALKESERVDVRWHTDRHQPEK